MVMCKGEKEVWEKKKKANFAFVFEVHIKTISIMFFFMLRNVITYTGISKIMVQHVYFERILKI